MNKPELKTELVAAGLNVVDIQDQYEMAIGLTGIPKQIHPGSRIVANVLGRDGNVIDTIKSCLRN